MIAMDSELALDQADTQAGIFAFLSDPATYRFQTEAGARDVGEVVRIDTHGAVVFLAGPDVYKVKRAVRFSFMDFSSLEKRRVACEHEIAVNRRNAPELYLGTVPIRRDVDGLHLGGARGAIVEWAVHLRRFDETQTFDRLADRGELALDLMAPLAETIAAAHELAPVRGIGATSMLRFWLEDTLEALASSDDIFPDQVDALRRDCMALFAELVPILDTRANAGFVRLCHGDLHLRNIALFEGRPVLFDAIEFDDAIATCDILYDFAFVLMDLWQRGLRTHANRLFNLYLGHIRETELTLEGLVTLPLFLALRAAIRARVTAALCRLEPEVCEGHIADARRFFAAAQDFVKVEPVRLIAIGGLSGSGKSTLAKEIASSLGRAPGAVHLRSDVERKRLFNVSAGETLPDEAYRPEITQQVYARLRHLAAIALEAGQSVIVDAVHAKPEERDALDALAAQIDVPFAGFWLHAPVETLVARVAARTNDVSDAKPSVVREQLGWDLGPLDWQRLDASRPIAELADMVLKRIA
ncbi:MAG: bifunctional aminoglycoside phosphotransferase/ATP-binding protein [Methylovirgula sp.]